MSTDFIGAGWASPLAITPSGGFALAGGTDKLEQSMRLILRTTPGERPMRPKFGCRLRDYLFRGTDGDTTAALAEEVRRALEFWEPRVDIDSVDVYPDPDQDGLLYLDIAYVVKQSNDRRNLVYPFYTIPEHEESY